MSLKYEPASQVPRVESGSDIDVNAFMGSPVTFDPNPENLDREPQTSSSSLLLSSLDLSDTNVYEP